MKTSSVILVNLWQMGQKWRFSFQSSFKYQKTHLSNIGYLFRISFLHLNIEILCSFLIFIYLLIFWHFLLRIYFQPKVLSHNKISGVDTSNAQIQNNIGFRANLATDLKINNQEQKRSFSSQNSSKSLRLDTRISVQKNLINQLKKLLAKIASLVKNWLIYLNQQIQISRRVTLESIIGYIGLPQRYVLSSMVFGDDSQLPSEIKHYLKITGMQHVIAVSGSNISLVVSLASVLISRFYGSSKLVILLALMIFYTLLTGSSASVIRASLMAGLSLTIYILLRRKIHPLTGWLWCVSLMVVARPAYLTEVSFQLSVLATLSIVLWGMAFPQQNSWLQNLTAGELLETNDWQKGVLSLVSALRESFLTTIAAQMLIFPVVIWWFGEVSLISLLANTCLLWLVPIITAAGLALFILATLTTFLPGHQLWLALLGKLIYWPVEFFLLGLKFFGQFEFGFYHLTLKNPLWLVIYYLSIAAWWWRKTR